VTGAAGAVAWRDLEAGAPEIARLGLARLAAARVALLGTLRRDRSPRISPVEPYVAGGELLIGVMASSAKAADLRRDQRCALHSAVTGPDAGEGELKLSGTAGVSVTVTADHTGDAECLHVVARRVLPSGPAGQSLIFRHPGAGR
jgi:hypothetical protein